MSWYLRKNRQFICTSRLYSFGLFFFGFFMQSRRDKRRCKGELEFHRQDDKPSKASINLGIMKSWWEMIAAQVETTLRIIHGRIEKVSERKFKNIPSSSEHLQKLQTQIKEIRKNHFRCWKNELFWLAEFLIATCLHPLVSTYSNKSSFNSCFSCTERTRIDSCERTIGIKEKKT